MVCVALLDVLGSILTLLSQLLPVSLSSVTHSHQSILTRIFRFLLTSRRAMLLLRHTPSIPNFASKRTAEPANAASHGHRPGKAPAPGSQTPLDPFESPARVCSHAVMSVRLYEVRAPTSSSVSPAREHLTCLRPWCRSYFGLHWCLRSAFRCIIIYSSLLDVSEDAD